MNFAIASYCIQHDIELLRNSRKRRKRWNNASITSHICVCMCTVRSKYYWRNVFKHVILNNILCEVKYISNWKERNVRYNYDLVLHFYKFVSFVRIHRIALLCKQIIRIHAVLKGCYAVLCIKLLPTHTRIETCKFLSSWSVITLGGNHRDWHWLLASCT